MAKNRRQRRAEKSAFNKQIKETWWEPFEDMTSKILDSGVPAPFGLKYLMANNKYSVQIFLHDTKWGEVTQLLIRRHDQAPIHDWGILQRIKNEIVGKEETAVEVYPKESQKVDYENLYHLWVLPEEITLPFGL